MAIRTKAPGMPGVETERTLTTGRESHRSAVYRDGVFIGDVVYVSRRTKAPAGSASATGFVTLHGWRPDGWRYSPNLALTSKADAIARLRSVLD